MNLNARVDVNCGWKEGRTDRRTDGRKTGRLYRTLLKQVRQKMSKAFIREKTIVREGIYWKKSGNN